MKTITKLTGTVTEQARSGPYAKSNGLQVHLPQNQCCSMIFDAAGLMMQVGPAMVAIPMSELTALMLPELGSLPWAGPSRCKKG